MEIKSSFMVHLKSNLLTFDQQMPQEDSAIIC